MQEEFSLNHDSHHSLFFSKDFTYGTYDKIKKNDSPYAWSTITSYLYTDSAYCPA